ncbi:molybdopterin molybdotransferase MoeA [Aspergillus undulatus]|uniref:molybdopterin molybdotransferase MoeA n=1 Tax=Aspergillus undulatus TaxID=1810928 RepID=UPI003CCDCA41
MMYAAFSRFGKCEAAKAGIARRLPIEKCSLCNACDRVVARTIYSPISTPEYDTSAMDGFALSAESTQLASPASPAVFEVTATTTAGDIPQSTVGDVRDGIPPAVEIMTGAPFPLGDGDVLDCCVPVEDVLVSENKSSNRRYISVSKPARRHQHRRFAGGDFSKGDTILKAGEVIQPQHIMALASVGLTEVPVVRKPRVAVFSTGSELISTSQSHPFMIHDVNGPYLTTMLRKWDVDAKLCGVVRDDQEAMERSIRNAVDEHDIVITSGAVSAGRCDIIPSLIKRIGGRTVFHKAAVKPGHPILFAVLPGKGGETAFFGLPGNPVAAAACLRFFVFKYIERLQGREREEPQTAILQTSHCPSQNGAKMAFKKEADIFRPAILSQEQVTIIADHSPGKTKPFLYANCWVHVPGGVDELGEGSEVKVYPL